MDNFIGFRVLPKLVYHNPKNINEVLEIIENSKTECKIIAGCTDFIPAIRRGAWRYGDGLNVIDIKHIENLKGIVKDGDIIRIGAATRLNDIVNSDIIHNFAPILSDAVKEMASPQIRNLGTIGGNLCTASPAADTAPPLLVLNAEVSIKGVNRNITVGIEDFFEGPGQTVMQQGDVLTEISFPAMEADEKGYYNKLGRRKAATLSVVSMAVWAKVRNNIFKEIRIALGAVAPTPMRAKSAESYLIGKQTSIDVFDEGARIVFDEINPITDIRATADYRRDMARTLTRRAMTEIAIH